MDVEFSSEPEEETEEEKEERLKRQQEELVSLEEGLVFCKLKIRGLLFLKTSNFLK